MSQICLRTILLLISVQICGGDTNKYSEIQIDINAFKQPIKKTGKKVYITSISVHILQYLGHISGYLFKSRLYDVNMFKFTLLGEFKQDIDKIYTRYTVI